jgi:hypothetical protein
MKRPPHEPSYLEELSVIAAVRAGAKSVTAIAQQTGIPKCASTTHCSIGSTSARFRRSGRDSCFLHPVDANTAGTDECSEHRAGVAHSRSPLSLSSEPRSKDERANS